jgi:hypothetical protein
VLDWGLKGKLWSRSCGKERRAQMLSWVGDLRTAALEESARPRREADRARISTAPESGDVRPLEIGLRA